MVDKTSPKGWIVRVTTKRFGGRPASVGIYDTAIPDPIEAVEAVRMVCDAGAHTIVEAIAELISGTDLRNGEVLLR
jgi:hypothetical protein